MTISKEKLAQLARQMQELGIREEDLIERFILGSGKGGQKINKTSSCVYLKHLPSGIEVKCQQERSRELNRFYARREICEKIAQQVYRIETEKKREIAKVRRQKKRRSRKSQAKILKAKKGRSETKQLRTPPPIE